MGATKHQIPEALRDVFAKLTGKDRSELESLEQLSDDEIQRVAGATGWGGNIHRYQTN